jgi:hypothetical protein
MLRIILAGFAVALVAHPAFSTSNWCAVVNGNVPDGYLNVRSSPKSVGPVLLRLAPGQIVGLSTGQCGAKLSDSGSEIGTVCVPPTSTWSLVEIIYDATGQRLLKASPVGWLNNKFVTAIPCLDEPE